jgi:undecaprenyl-diphosphatase
VSPFELDLFRRINQGPEALAPTMKFFSEGANIGWVRIILLLVVLAMAARGPKSRRAAVQALLAFPLANGITDLFKRGLPDPRPFQVLSDVILRVGWSPSMGTASAHSANMAAVATVMTYHLGGWGAIWVGIAAITGYSRAYNGAHFPHQVLLGWSCGVVAGLVVSRGWDEIVRRRQAPSSDATGPGTETEIGSLKSR